MPKGLRKVVKENLQKCHSAAIAAVGVYNRPGPEFRTAHYVVMIIIAWTALFHAMFYNKGRRPWFRKRTSGTGTGIRYQKIDGDPKHWDLAECVKQHFGSRNTPERKNLEFLIGLRNKIEHRYLPALDASLYGECQASLMNLEALMVSEFGQRYALSGSLAVSLQFTQVIPAEKRKAARQLASSAAESVKGYVETFRGKLHSDVLNSTKYSFNVYLVPKLANRKSAADAAVEFFHVNEASKEEIERLDRLNVLIREKHIPIANLDLLKPGQVVDAVNDRLPHCFHMGTHIAAWRHFAARPRSGDKHPERTQSEYCVYDSVHGDYLYTRAWIEKLVRDLTDPEDFAEAIGREAEPK